MKPIGKQTITVVSGAVASLTEPTGAKLAVISCDCDATSTDKNKAVRYWLTGDEPTASQGHHLGNIRNNIVIGGTFALANAKFIGIEADKSHLLQVTYWK